MSTIVIISCLSLLLFVCIVIIVPIIVAHTLNNKHKRKMSFKESLALTDLPVITFYQGNLKVNFLLDSGSNYSHIIPSAVDKLKGEVIDSSIEISGIGKGESNKLFRTTLEYNKKHFAVDLYLTEHLVQAFIDIKKETGVSIHGILGNKFFQDYKYILDFNKLEAYSAK